MRHIIKSTILIITYFLVTISLFAQNNFLSEDYKLFGRKEPISLGSVFSALATSPIMANPASVAFVTDNRISIGLSTSEIGSGLFFSCMAPNLSISSATQTATKNDSIEQDHKKQLLHFNFSISSEDLGFSKDGNIIAIGISVKRQMDKLIQNDETIEGGNAVSVDVGMLYKWKQLTMEVIIVDINNPKLNNTTEDTTEVSYKTSFIVGGRYTTARGLTIAVQGIGGESYTDSDWGINLGAEQSFLNYRLISRIQMTSFFKGSEATMQNISGNIGYRLDPKYSWANFLKDLELSYTLSFLTMPKVVGTHLLTLTKYF
ncbi:MAG: hypothetical protein KAW87_02135 [Candidatus Cloacimonetes bacterium]|nr:hypothetical protein [Candidatus Cloacimonadota bacterium]